MLVPCAPHKPMLNAHVPPVLHKNSVFTTLVLSFIASFDENVNKKTITRKKKGHIKNYLEVSKVLYAVLPSCCRERKRESKAYSSGFP